MRIALLFALLAATGCATSPSAGTEPIDGPPQTAEAPPPPKPVPRERPLEEEQELMRYAMRVHLEKEHHDAAHLIEHGLHARELARSGRTDDEAMRVRRTAPKREMLRRQIGRAAEVLADAGNEDGARQLTAFSHELWIDPLAGTEEPRGRPDAADREIQVVKERIEVMRWGVEIWVEKGRHDLAEKLEWAIVSRRMAIEGRRDAEAREVREKAPNHGMLAELLHGAGRAYEEKGWETRAAACFELSKVYGEQWHRQRERNADRERAEALQRFMVRTEQLEVQVRRLTERLEKLEAERK
jgi:hypothetical protein